MRSTSPGRSTGSLRARVVRCPDTEERGTKNSAATTHPEPRLIRFSPVVTGASRAARPHAVAGARNVLTELWLDRFSDGCIRVHVWLTGSGAGVAWSPRASARKVGTKGWNAPCNHYVARLQGGTANASNTPEMGRSEEHTSELQSQSNLVCRLLL